MRKYSKFLAAVVVDIYYISNDRYIAFTEICVYICCDKSDGITPICTGSGPFDYLMHEYFVIV